jgi:HEAT repeat protein
MRVALTGVLTACIWFVAYAEGAEVRHLVAKLKEKDSDLRRAAAKELSELGAEAKSAVPDLIRTMRDKDLFVRRYSAEALGNIGLDAKTAIPALAAALNDDKKEVAEAAVDALSKIGPDSIAALTSALKDANKDPNVRRKAAIGLSKLGLRAHGAVSAMTDILSGKVKAGKKGKGNDDDIRVEVASALGSVAKRDDAAAIKALKAVSEGKQKNKALKKAAGDALRQINGKEN